MRPRDLDEFLGQATVVGPGTLLRRAIEEDRVGSLLLYGPAGSGKTTLASIIARRTRAHFETLNAVTAGVADIRRVVAEARERRALYGRRTILFIDEVHRFNKAQQDVLLPAVEQGLVTLIGATTENPFFSLTGPLLSRCRLFRLEALSDEDVGALIDRALADRERGLGDLGPELEPAARDHLVRFAEGDARRALNVLEAAVLATPPGEDGVRRVTLAVAVDAAQRKALAYDRDGDRHYDTVSAFIKSIRGSDPDAAVYWLARMLEAGEDPRFIARRLVVHAAEDVGNADPTALVVATAAAQAVEFVGLPEARLPLAQATLYLACAPKSNAVLKAISRAGRDVAEKPAAPVPVALRDTAYPGARRLGHGEGYLYPHDFPGAFVEQEYLPEALRDARYYEPGDQGAEAAIRERLAGWRRRRQAKRGEGEGARPGDGTRAPG